MRAHSDNPVAAITGAAGGIGSAVAERFASSGYQLALLDRIHPEMPEDSQGSSFKTDLTDPSAVSQTFKEIEAQFGRLNALVNVAGINHKSSVAEMAVEDWDRMMNTNVGSMFLTAKYGVPLLEKGKQSAIVNMASVSGHVASADYPAYVTTKAAVESFTIALSQEIGDRGIRVNAVAPGWVDAGFTDEAKAAAKDPATLDAAAKKAHLLGRMAMPSEVADAIIWLCSQKAVFMTGQILFVDGGFMRNH